MAVEPEVGRALVEPEVEPEAEAQGNGDELTGLMAALAQVPDGRKARGVRYPQSGVLGLCVLAFMSGAQSLSGVHRFGADNPKVLSALGLARRESPSVATLSRMMARIESRELQKALAGWMDGIVRRAVEAGRIGSVDGKSARASGVHVLNVFLNDLGRVAWAAAVDKKSNEIKVLKEELPALLESYPFLELILGDAMFAGGPLCEMLVENGRHYLFQVKASQPDLLEKLEYVFARHLRAKPKPDRFDGEKKARVRGGAGIVAD